MKFVKDAVIAALAVYSALATVRIISLERKEFERELEAEIQKAFDELEEKM